MEISGYVKRRLKEPEIAELINNNEWGELYENFPNEYCNELTFILLNIGIDPLKYMDYIPAGYFRDFEFSYFTIPKHIKEIKYTAFRGCKNLTSIDIPNSVEKIEAQAFYNCGKFLSIELPPKLKIIKHYCFGYCKELKSIVIPTSIEEIDEVAFYGCTKLKNVNYLGTKEQWQNILIYDNTLRQCSIICSNGELICDNDGKWVPIN